MIVRKRFGSKVERLTVLRNPKGGVAPMADERSVIRRM